MAVIFYTQRHTGNLAKAGNLLLFDTVLRKYLLNVAKHFESIPFEKYGKYRKDQKAGP